MKYLTVLIRFLPILARLLTDRASPGVNKTALLRLLYNFQRAAEHFELTDRDWLSFATLITNVINGTALPSAVDSWWHDLNLGRKPLQTIPPGYIVHRPLRSNQIIRDVDY
jgi:hypothetical protein